MYCELVLGKSSVLNAHDGKMGEISVGSSVNNTQVPYLNYFNYSFSSFSNYHLQLYLRTKLDKLND